MSNQIIIKLQRRNQPRKYIYDYIATVEHRDVSGEFKFGGAVSLDEDDAKTRAIHEALERFGGSRIEKTIKSMSVKSLRESVMKFVDPFQIAPFSNEQFSNPIFPYDRLEDEQIIGWVMDTQDGILTAYPARSVYLGYSSAKEPRYMPTSSCGLAIHKTFDLAQSNAVKELIERDAAMMTWFSGVSPDRYDLSSIKDPELCDFIAACQKDQQEIVICDITCDTNFPCYLSCTISEIYPRVTFGLAADFDILSGIRKSLEEAVMIRNSLEIIRRSQVDQYSVEDPHMICSFMDHALFYANKENDDKWKFLLNGGMKTVIPKKESHHAHVFSEVMSRFGIMTLDITPQLFENMNLKLVRAVSTVLYSMNMRHSAPYLGSNRIHGKMINQFPHPFA